MKLSELIAKTDMDDVIDRIIKHYPHQKNNSDGYAQVYKTLSNKSPSDNVGFIRIVELLNVYGNNDGFKVQILIDEKILAPDFLPWGDFLNFTVEPETLKNYTHAEILAHCLYEMTFYGFTEDEMRKGFDNIMSGDAIL